MLSALFQCRSDRSRHDQMFSLSTLWISSLCGDGYLRSVAEVSFPSPDRPDYSRQLIGAGDRRFVVTAPGCDSDRPLLKPRPRAFSPSLRLDVPASYTTGYHDTAALVL